MKHGVYIDVRWPDGLNIQNYLIVYKAITTPPPKKFRTSSQKCGSF